jgi:hypothetical protein
VSEPLTHEQLFELVADLESAVFSLRNGISDGIYALESRLLVLERKNRELRGQLAELEGRERKSFNT